MAFGIKPEGGKKVTHTEYIKKLQESLRESYRIAVEHSEKIALRNKQRYDLRVRESTLHVGDRVLVKNVGIRGKHKIADRWSNTIFQVVKQINESPVYVVKPLTTNGPEKTLHRDLLLPCGFLTSTSPTDESDREERKEEMSCPKEALLANEFHYLDEFIQEPVQDHDVDYYFPQTTQDTSYPTITIIREVPYNKGINEDTIGITLNPNARAFEPSVSKEDVHLPGETMTEDNLPGKFLVKMMKPVNELNSTSTARNDDESTQELIVNDVEPVEQKENETREDKHNNSETVSVEHDLNNKGIPAQEMPELRRSTRHREQPDRLNYKSLGNPLALVMHSLLEGLGQAFTQALETDVFPQVRVLAPDTSEVL